MSAKGSYGDETVADYAEVGGFVRAEGIVWSKVVGTSKFRQHIIGFSFPIAVSCLTEHESTTLMPVQRNRTRTPQWGA